MLRRLLLGSLGLVMVIAGLKTFAVLFVTMDEAGVPPRSSIPALPSDVRILSEDVACGSGGCWREVTVTTPGDATDASLATRLGGDQERCRPRTLIDRRVVCTWVDVIGGRVRIYVNYQRPLD